MSELRRVRSQIRRSYQGPAWHGPSLMETLKDVDAAQAAAHPIAGAHSIWELVLHAQAWLAETARAVTGATYQTLKGDADWPPVSDPSDAGWQATLASLEETQGRLYEAVTAMTEDALCTTVPGQEFTFYGLLHGVAQHNIYHAGQIAMLKIAMPKKVAA